MLKVIGIDPGLAATGVGIICGKGMTVNHHSYGAINTNKLYTLPQRLNKIFDSLTKLLEQEQPHLMIVEDVYSLGKYPKSGIVLGKVSGVILLAGIQNDLPIHEVAVREAKKILTGTGTANKAQLEKAVRHALKQTKIIRPFHASDALALALIGLYRFGQTQQVRRIQ